MAALALLLVFTTGCEAVADFIPDGDPTAGNPDRTASPETTPILPNPGFGGGGGLPTSAIPDHELARTVVQVRAIDERGEAPATVRVGSGVIIDEAARLILTSYTLVQQNAADGSRAYTTLGIAMAPEAGANPELRFRAEVAFADPTSQLAVLRVMRDFEGEGFTEEAFTGIAAVFDGTAATTAGSPLRIFGHPSPSPDGSDTQPVSMTNASVTGFRSAPGQTGRTWIKTDVRLPSALAGGPVFDQRGVLLGVLVQERYLAGGGVGHVRPIDLARELIASARQQPDAAPYQAPIRLYSNISGDTQPLEGQGWVSQPLFAANANDTITGRDLFDYTNVFPPNPPQLYYEFTLAGIEDGATIEERWFLDGLEQDSLSSSYVWDGGSFGYVSDRIVAAGEQGLPRGSWGLELWVNGELRARGTALIGVDLAQPTIENFDGGATADSARAPASAVENGSEQLLAFFDFAGFEGVQEFSWSVFHNNSRIYQSPLLRWDYGGGGRTWVGYRDPRGPIGSGSWEVEIYADGNLLGTVAIEVE